MLEYMLARPQDDPFFGAGLEMVIIDEAHLYRGTLAAEITLLLRRLLTRCTKHPDDVLFVGTSATLGGNEIEQRRFFATLTGKEVANVTLIRGERAPIDPLPASTDQVEWVPLDGYSSDSIKQIATNWNELATLRKTLWESGSRPVSISSLAEKIWPSEDADSRLKIVPLLQRAASVALQQDTTPLVPHRLHLPVRGSSGLSLCLSTDCDGPESQRIQGFGCLQSTAGERCRYCSAKVLPIVRCRHCGAAYMAGTLNKLYLSSVNLERHTHSVSPDLTVVNINPTKSVVSVDPATGEILLTGSGTDAPKICLIEEEEFRCLQCNEAGKDLLRSCIDNAGLILTLLVEGMLAQLPPYDRSQRGETDALSTEILPARGRRLLVFSDSRREAARLGPVLTWQHEVQLVRSLMLKTIETNLYVDDEYLDALRAERDSLEVRWVTTENPALKARYRSRLQTVEAEISAAESGGSMGTWVDLCKEKSADLICQLLDHDSARTHKAQNWDLDRWQENTDAVRKKLFLLLGRETLRPSTTLSTLETLGLVEIVYPGLQTVEMPNSLFVTLQPNTRSELEGAWGSILSALLDSLRVDSAITLGTPEDDYEAFQGPRPLGLFATEVTVDQMRSVPFIGATKRQRRRHFAARVLEAVSLSHERSQLLAADLLKAAFDQILELSREWDWLERGTVSDRHGFAKEGIRLKVSGLALRSPSRIYMDRVSGRVVSQAPFGLHPLSDSAMLEIRPTELDSDPRFARQRRELRSDGVFRIGLWAEEHSAQLSSLEARRIQDLFEKGIRNVLSCSTTMELGVDIGGLEGVLMSNVPPNQARYRQRAGRAGRRGSGSAVSVVFARQQPFDREVFKRFHDYLERLSPPPSIILERDLIVQRHIHAHLLSAFMRTILSGQGTGAMQAYGRMGRFTSQPAIPKWDKSTPSKPQLQNPRIQENWSISRNGEEHPWGRDPSSRAVSEQFVDFLNWLKRQPEGPLAKEVRSLTSGTNIESKFSPGNWPDACSKIITNFTGAVENWRKDYNHYLEAWDQITDQRREANFLFYQANQLYRTTVIEQLANQQFFPRYGFPIGLLQLKVNSDIDPSRIETEDRFSLQRDGTLALREYAPGSKLIVGSREIESRGILKHWTGANLDTALGARRTLVRCMNDHPYSLLSSSSDAPCPHCGEPQSGREKDLLHVQFGFSTAAWQSPRQARSAELIGEAALLPFPLQQHSMAGPAELDSDCFAGIRGLHAVGQTGAKLLVTNEGNGSGFAVCLHCGYAETEKYYGKGQMELPAGFDGHRPLNASPFNGKLPRSCWQKEEPMVLRNQVLAVEVVTDFASLDFMECSPDLAKDRHSLIAVGLAARHAAGQMLMIDPNEIGMILQPQGSHWRLFMYDNVPGGAGHSNDLFSLGRKWLEETRKRLFVNLAHHQQCISGCLDCVISYEGQYQLPDSLNRKLAHDQLAALLSSQ